MLQNVVKPNDFSPSKRSPPVDPPQVERTIRVMKVVQFSQTVSEGASADFSPAEIAAAVPGGLTYWNNFRIERIDAWGTAQADATLSLTLAPQSGWNQPPFTVLDSNTSGQRRPACGVKLGLLDRARFWGPADETTLVTVSQSVAGLIIVQATIELISPP